MRGSPLYDVNLTVKRYLLYFENLDLSLLQI
jgi:hypothetical protein